MVKHMCHNCHDLEFGNITKVIDHVWLTHSIIVERKLEYVWAAVDARQSLKKKRKKRISSYRCNECDILLRNTRSLLKHLDEKHGIHVWYERGIAKKRVFFDGILENTLTQEQRKRKAWIPISKRPFEPRRSDKSEDAQ